MVYINFVDKNGNVFLDNRGYKFLVRSADTKIIRTLTLDEFRKLVENNTMKCSFYLYSLYDDESVKEDLSPYVLEGGSLSIN